MGIKIYLMSDIHGDIKALSDEERFRLNEFLKGLPLYMEIDSSNFNFNKPILLTHSGIDADHYVTKQNGDIDVCKSIEKAAGDREFKYLISNDIHYASKSDRSRFDRYIICGHVPTISLNEDGTSGIYKTKNYMCIDSGSGFRDRGGKLSCYCLNNDKVWYV